MFVDIPTLPPLDQPDPLEEDEEEEEDKRGDAEGKTKGRSRRELPARVNNIPSHAPVMGCGPRPRHPWIPAPFLDTLARPWLACSPQAVSILKEWRLSEEHVTHP